MISYQELEQQAAELLRQAEQIREHERNGVIAQVREVIAEWNISASELGFKVGRNGDKRKTVVKFRHPITGASWSGHGRTPRWLSDELASGASREQFLVAA